jgi:hypothetical protein
MHPGQVSLGVQRDCSNVVHKLLEVLNLLFNTCMSVSSDKQFPHLVWYG